MQRVLNRLPLWISDLVKVRTVSSCAPRVPVAFKEQILAPAL